MKPISVLLDPETLVLCEKAAAACGKTVAEWISFLIAQGVGHTSFCHDR
jgi:hypothetical protein